MEGDWEEVAHREGACYTSLQVNGDLVGNLP